MGKIVKTIIKKIESLITPLVIIFFIWAGIQEWYGLFSGYIPWKKTFYFNYEDYRKTLDNYGLPAYVKFAEEIPASGKASLRAYSQHDTSFNRYTGYSIVLEENDYNMMIKGRMNYYWEYCNEFDNEPVLCKEQSEEVCSILDFNEPGADISYLDHLIRYPENKQDYYFLIVTKANVSRGTCYSGVIVNDNTHEIIEFSIEIDDEDGF